MADVSLPLDCWTAPILQPQQFSANASTTRTLNVAIFGISIVTAYVNQRFWGACHFHFQHQKLAEQETSVQLVAMLVSSWADFDPEDGGNMFLWMLAHVLTAWCCIPEDDHSHNYRCENLKSYNHNRLKKTCSRINLYVGLRKALSSHSKLNSKWTAVKSYVNTNSQSVLVSYTRGAHDRISISLSCGFIDVGCPLRPEDGSVVYSCSFCFQHSHSQVWVPRDSQPYIPLSDWLKTPLTLRASCPYLYPLEQGGQVIPSGTGLHLCVLLQLKGHGRGIRTASSFSNSFPLITSWCRPSEYTVHCSVKSVTCCLTMVLYLVL
jgi:hypothetical protein